MIDTHCHILPIDDGAKDIEESIEMIRIAEKEGIKKIINTSHFNKHKYITDKSTMKVGIDKLNDILKIKKIDVEILQGSELYYSEDLIDRVDEICTLADSSYILLEFQINRFPENIKDIVYEFQLKGYKVIIAHPERYPEIREDISILKDIISEGGYIQINASNIIASNKEMKKTCKEIIENNYVHLIASDGHNTQNRKPQLKEAYEYISKKYGVENAQKLFYTNPEKIINNEDMLAINTKKKFKIKEIIKKLINNSEV